MDGGEMTTRRARKRGRWLVGIVRRRHRPPLAHVALVVPVYCAINSLSFVMTNVVKM
jgi:hypothetical protein